jgi:hypothetical protein
MCRQVKFSRTSFGSPHWLKRASLAILSTALLGTANAQTTFESMPVLNPLPLVRPIASSTLQLMLREADSLYRSGAIARATTAYWDILELQPQDNEAWLRMGNIWQQEAKFNWALQAYSLAGRTAPEGNNEFEVNASVAQVRAKALINLANLHLRQAQTALSNMTALQEHDAQVARDFAHQSEQLNQELAERKNELKVSAQAVSNTKVARSTSLVRTSLPPRAQPTVYVGNSAR